MKEIGHNIRLKVNVFKPFLVVILVAGLLLTPEAPNVTAISSPTSTRLIQPDDLIYLGAFAYPAGDEWAYSGHAMAYYPEGDPAGPDDGYPGSLYVAGHRWYDLVGEITIPEPVIADSFDELPKASVLQPLTDITGGWKDNCTYADDCVYREVDGLEYLHNINKIAWNLRDWYNTAGYDQDSLGWSDLDMTNAQGVWHIGERPSEDNVFHNAKTCNYLFKAPEDFAAQYLEGKWLIAGNHREAGAFGGSQGPTLYAVAPWEDGNPPTPGQNLDALALVYYPPIPGCLDDPNECYFPNYRAKDSWEGGVWIETPDKRGILIFGRKGLGENCYGTPEECGGDPCDPYKGWHAYPYEPQILFYDPEEVKEVMAGTREPWEVLPYATYSPVDEVLGGECAKLGAAAYDLERGLIYVAEEGAGPWGETAVHVWKIHESAAGAELVFRVTREGEVYTDGAFFCGLGSGCFNAGTGADIAEWVLVSEPVEPGEVLEIDPDHLGFYRKARGPYSHLIAGVVSTTPGFTLGEPGEGKALLALLGTVLVKATAENGPIRPGDLLVSSSTPGYVMRCPGPERCVRALLGKALGPLGTGTGQIRILVLP